MADALAELIRRKLREGLLPNEPAIRVLTRQGGGGSCEACDQPIRPRQLDYEVEFTRGRVVRFHAACFQTWSSERRRK